VSRIFLSHSSTNDADAKEQKPLKVFISYSRKDEDFAQELLAGLELAGFEPYLDKHDIAAGEDWEARLGRLIEAADTVVFVISPDAVASERCAWEVERTVALKKRLLPIVWRRVEEAQVPPSPHAAQLHLLRSPVDVDAVPFCPGDGTQHRHQLGSRAHPDRRGGPQVGCPWSRRGHAVAR
jgi:TIR domain